MQTNFTSLHELWVTELLASPEWEPACVFGLSNRAAIDSLFPPKKEISKQLAHAKKFEKQLVILSKQFKFNILEPQYIKYSDTVLAAFGNLGYGVAEQLLKTLNASRSHIQSLKDKLAHREEINKQKRKPGPFKKIPPFFAESVLVGLSLHSNSDDGKKLLKQFLEPRDRFRPKCTTQFHQSVPVNFM